MTKGKWVSRAKPNKSGIPDAVREEVTAKAHELIEMVLKPKYLKPPPENPYGNYIIDLYGKWYRHYFYLCTTYRVTGPNAMVPSFEWKFARLEYAGNRCFHLSFMRYTGKEWVGLYAGLSLDECLTAIRDESYFEM